MHNCIGVWWVMLHQPHSILSYSTLFLLRFMFRRRLRNAAGHGNTPPWEPSINRPWLILLLYHRTVVSWPICRNGYLEVWIELASFRTVHDLRGWNCTRAGKLTQNKYHPLFLPHILIERSSTTMQLCVSVWLRSREHIDMKMTHNPEMLLQKCQLASYHSS